LRGGPRLSAPSASTSFGASEPDLHAEIALIDRARAALAGGDPKQALAVLGTYSRSYPRGTLGPEATLLKIQAWVALGDRARARSLGRAFLEAHPKSPLAARVRSLIGEQSPKPASR
jgi:outer membrane protein assembly factor BamD (BamD/ComL family)